MTDESTVLKNLRTAHIGDWGLDLSSQEVHELWAEIEAKDKRVAELVQTLSHIVYRGGQIIVNLNERVREDEWNRLTRGIVVDEERER